MDPKILIIDDDAKLNQLLISFLTDFGFEVFSATDPAQGLKLIGKRSPQLVILDVMMPGMDGFEVCRKIRQTSSVPVIMLTARGDVTDKVVGLELGADDYLAKPFEPRELVARIHSVLRRSGVVDISQPAVFGSLTVDFSRRIAELDHVSLE